MKIPNIVIVNITDAIAILVGLQKQDNTQTPTSVFIIKESIVELKINRSS